MCFKSGIVCVSDVRDSIKYRAGVTHFTINSVYYPNAC